MATGVVYQAVELADVSLDLGHECRGTATIVQVEMEGPRASLRGLLQVPCARLVRQERERDRPTLDQERLDDGAPYAAAGPGHEHGTGHGSLARDGVVKRALITAPAMRRLSTNGR